ncbi:FHA domain-containing protein [Thermocrispum municipale]|uniref:FHA domain-containing protein n=1 Tax=Thermocrispum municipale TaxID=37926 RepID=UPI001FDF460B|nr:FHA domain-containing protein [Thermocrispum municipale]
MSKRTSPIPGLAKCPTCGTQLQGRFCEACGTDTLPGAPPPVPVQQPAHVEPPKPEPPPATWTAVVSVDRAHFDAVTAAGNGTAPGGFPADWEERRFELHGNQVSIGRRSRTRNIKPDIDLAGPPEDYGVSHLHAVLVPRTDNTWSIVDVGSTNGTMLNDQPYPLAANVPHPLRHGDRIYLGAWTVITIEVDPPH